MSLGCFALLYSHQPARKIFVTLLPPFLSCIEDVLHFIMSHSHLYGYVYGACSYCISFSVCIKATVALHCWCFSRCMLPIFNIGIVKQKRMILEDDCIFHIGAMAETVPDAFLLCVSWMSPLDTCRKRTGRLYVLHHVSWGLLLLYNACEWAELCK